MVRFSDIFKKKQDNETPVDISNSSGPVTPGKIQPALITSEPSRLGGTLEQPAQSNEGQVKITSDSDKIIDRGGAGGVKTPLPLFFKKIKMDKPKTFQAKQENISFAPLSFPEGAAYRSSAERNAAELALKDDNLRSVRRDFRPAGTDKLNNISLAEAVKIKEDDNLQKSGELYSQLIYLVEEVLANIENGRFPDTLMMVRIIEAVKETVNLMIIKERSLLDLTYDYPFPNKTGSGPKNYIFFHLVNVCILSLEIARELGYNKSRLQALGVVALLHDKRIHSFLNTTVSQEIKSEADKFAKNFSDVAEILREVTHSHFDDEQSGEVRYPEIKNQAIGEQVQLFTLTDIFETMIHSRPDRKKKSVQQAIRELLEISASPFTKNALKILIKQIGLYPVGSWVELNTGEIARVVKINAKLPLRPVVHIFFDAQRKKMTAHKIFNLVDNQNVYIKNTIDETELEL
ncbi:MAG: hypothetical protein AAB019_01745 [Planctomycetota bacterium]